MPAAANKGRYELNSFRPLVILKIVMENTDDETYITTPQILAKLESDYNIIAHRQTIRYDIDNLNSLGFEIERTKGISNQYRYVGRNFDTAELRILIDAVVSSKSLSRKKSMELANKITRLSGGCTTYALSKCIDVNQRVKSPNESIYYITNAVNEAINLSCKISFLYFEYNYLKERKYKNKGREYVFSPYRMLWDGDFYYMVGFSDKHNKVVSFRMDRIDHAPTVLEEIDAIPIPSDFDLNYYINTMPRMHNSGREEITIEFNNSVAGAVFDRFGYEVDVSILDKNRSSITLCTAVGPVLYSWVAGFAGKVKLVASDKVMKEYRDMLSKALDA